jgi:hypothetical protein
MNWYEVLQQIFELIIYPVIGLVGVYLTQFISTKIDEAKQKTNNEKAINYKEENGKKYFFVSGVVWFTNMEHNIRNSCITLQSIYQPDLYPKYDNTDIIEVSRTKKIPMDYAGVMGVPITFLHKYNPNQFEIIGLVNSSRWIGDIPCFTIINGKNIYHRFLIKNKQL